MNIPEMLVMLLLSASLAGSAVCEDEADATGGYAVTSAKAADEDNSIWRIYDTTTQGGTNWHNKIVSTNINTLIVDELGRHDRLSSAQDIHDIHDRRLRARSVFR